LPFAIPVPTGMGIDASAYKSKKTYQIVTPNPSQVFMRTQGVGTKRMDEGRTRKKLEGNYVFIFKLENYASRNIFNMPNMKMAHNNNCLVEFRIKCCIVVLANKLKW
jgi:hypothetical protein